MDDWRRRELRFLRDRHRVTQPMPPREFPHSRCSVHPCLAVLEHRRSAPLCHSVLQKPGTEGPIVGMLMYLRGFFFRSFIKESPLPRSPHGGRLDAEAPTGLPSTTYNGCTGIPATATRGEWIIEP